MEIIPLHQGLLVERPVEGIDLDPALRTDQKLTALPVSVPVKPPALRRLTSGEKRKFTQIGAVLAIAESISADHQLSFGDPALPEGDLFQARDPQALPSLQGCDKIGRVEHR